MNRKKYSDAEQDMHKAAVIAPNSPAPYVQMGNLHQVQKQYAEAIKSYQQALDKDPASTDGLQGMMNTYIAQKQLDQAVAAAKAQIGKSPNVSGFYDRLLLGTALFQKKDIKGADAAFTKAVEYDKNNSDALLKLAQAQAAEGSVSQALATYQQSIKDHPREISFYILVRHDVRIAAQVGSSQEHVSAGSEYSARQSAGLEQSCVCNFAAGWKC